MPSLSSAAQLRGIDDAYARASWHAYREAAALVRAAGCICSRNDERDPDIWIYGLEPVESRAAGADAPLLVAIHNPRCPIALADAIEQRGKE